MTVKTKKSSRKTKYEAPLEREKKKNHKPTLFLPSKNKGSQECEEKNAG